MTAILRNLRVDFGSLVDEPANKGARIMLFKRDGEAETPADDPIAALEKVGRKMAGKRLAQFKSALEVLSGLLSELNDASEDSEENAKESEMSKKTEAATEPQAEASAEVVKADAVVETAPAPQDDAIAKMAAEVADLRKRAEAAEAVAKAERDARLTAEWIAKAEGFSNLTVAAGTLGPILKRASETLSAEDMGELERVLAAAHEQVGKSALFETVGKAGDDSVGNAWEKVEALAKAEVEKNPKLTIEKARVNVLRANRDLRDAYYNERGAH